jgi:hypothetical protein
MFERVEFNSFSSSEEDRMKDEPRPLTVSITNLSRFSWLFALEQIDIRNTNITIFFIFLD